MQIGICSKHQFVLKFRTVEKCAKVFMTSVKIEETVVFHCAAFGVDMLSNYLTLTNRCPTLATKYSNG